MRSASDNDRGLYGKFYVTRRDGGSDKGKKHNGCEYFVIDLAHDEFAGPALQAYADACQEKFPLLADDLRIKFGFGPDRRADSDWIARQPCEAPVYADDCDSCEGSGNISSDPSWEQPCVECPADCGSCKPCTKRKEGFGK